MLTLSSVQGEMIQSLDNKKASNTFGIKSLGCSDHCRVTPFHMCQFICLYKALIFKQ